MKHSNYDCEMACLPLTATRLEAAYDDSWRLVVASLCLDIKVSSEIWRSTTILSAAVRKCFYDGYSTCRPGWQ